MSQSNNVIIIGGGASGMLAAVTAAVHGAHVTLLEKNSQLGKKILISGKGRCNVTNDKSVDQLIASFSHNGKFLFTAFHSFNNEATKTFFEQAGVPLKVERGDRVFPVSDKAKDIVDALIKQMRQKKVVVKNNAVVKKIMVRDQKVSGVLLADGQKLYANKVILATGGASYPGTGSTGDGYHWAESFGHTIIPIRPALVPLEVNEPWIKELQGLSLKNIRLTLADENGKKIADDFGEMLFTHFGISGPIVLTVSSKAVDYWQNSKQPLQATIDFKHALSVEQLNARILREIDAQHNKQLKNILGTLMPQKLINTFIMKTGLDQHKVMHQITKDERFTMVDVLKNFTFSVTHARPLTEAIVTAGGISTKEVSPKTMESKIIQGLFFAGEILDIDGITGGFNLQAAFSTGYLAGRASAQMAD